MSSGFNLIGKSDGGTGFTAPTDQQGTIAAPLDPKLDPAGVQDNGGPTSTIALSCASPATNRGTSNGLGGNLSTDQRGAGFARSLDDPSVPNATNGDGADVGAFELQTICSATPDPFVAYAVKTTKGTPAFVARGPVILGDTFGTAAYTVAKPVTLALPAEVNGAAPADDDTHLLEHQIKPFKGATKFTPRVDVHVVNLCSNVFVTVKKPVSLLVPTAEDLATPVTAPLDAEHERDHRLCYHAKVATKRADGTKLPKPPKPPKGTQVDVVDQFQTRRYDLKALTKLCVPTAKSGSPVFLKGEAAGTPAPLTSASVRHADDVLVCYRATLAKRTIPQAGCGAVDPTAKGTPIVPGPAKHAPRGGVFVANHVEEARRSTTSAHDARSRGRGVLARAPLEETYAFFRSGPRRSIGTGKIVVVLLPAATSTRVCRNRS